MAAVYLFLYFHQIYFHNLKYKLGNKYLIKYCRADIDFITFWLNVFRINIYLKQICDVSNKFLFTLEK